MALRDDVIAATKHPAVVQARRSIGRTGREGPTSFLVDGHSLLSQAIASSVTLGGRPGCHRAGGDPER